MNLLGKITKTQVLLLFMAGCFLVTLCLLYLQAGRRMEGTDYRISTGRGSSAPEESVTVRPVNINTADAEELQTLPGIGEVLAYRIIRYREECGPFADMEELLEVEGIGETVLEGLRGRITVSR